VTLTDVIGWLGALGILVAYGLLTAGRWPSGSMRYQGLNAVAAAMLLLWAVAIKAWPSAMLNLVWMLVGIVGVAKIVRHDPVAPPPHRGD
jgi:hypothetical protein